MRIRVVGIGTDFGDDAVGPRVVQLLASCGGLPPDVDAVRCSRPIELLDLLEGCDGVVLVDATVSGRPPGTVHEPTLGDLREARPMSSHGLGVREALSMARALGRAPGRIAIVGVEAESTSGPEVSAPVREALERAAATVRGRCDAWRASANGGS